MGFNRAVWARHAGGALIAMGTLIVVMAVSGCVERDSDPVDDAGSEATESPVTEAGGDPEGAEGDAPDPSEGGTDSGGPDSGGTDGEGGPDGTGDEGGGDDTAQVAPGQIDGRSLPWPGWDNATVYFAITDRFYDGNPDNNDAYGRQMDGEDEVGTFHGGDFAGLTEKLEENFFLDLGVSAIWISAPYEQVHGWVVGGGGGFKHYSYHGYYPLDWTNTDAAFGTAEEFRTFVDTAHEQGIRVVLDVVMNHAGYATAVDLDAYGVDVLSDGWQDAGVGDYYDFIDFDSRNFADWWGPQWIRADLGGGYSQPGTDAFTQDVGFLPDFKTESPVTGVKLPVFFANKADTLAVERRDYRVRDYLIEWITYWPREFGVDGFRCDTAKHVEREAWAELKVAANAALAEWRQNNPEKAFADSDYPNPDAPFWMTGEVFPHGVVKDDYFDNGFDSLINFDFQNTAAKGLEDIAEIEQAYATYAAAINSDPDFNVLSYISSHDTSVFFTEDADSDLDAQKLVGTYLLLTPGAVQVFYGDENAREEGIGGGDATQGTRSDYVWGANPDVLEHWQKLGVFRKKHRAVGAGAHQQLSESPYVFSRVLDDDTVVVAIGLSGRASIDVSSVWDDGAEVVDTYTGATATVESGTVTLDVGDGGVVTLETANR